MSDCGAPVFENIDELLTEKITRHSKHHSDTSPPRPDDSRIPDEPSISSQPCMKKKRSPSIAAIVFLVISVLIILLYLYRPSPDSSAK